MSKQQRFTVDTPHGRFGTNNPSSHLALIFKKRNGSGKADVVWMKTQVMADFQRTRFERLGFHIIGCFESTEHVDGYLTRVRARQSAERLAKEA